MGDTWNGRLQLCPAALPGFPCETMAEGLIDPQDVAVNADGDYLVLHQSVEVLRCPAASPGSLCEQVVAGRFTHVSGGGLAIDTDGSLLIAYAGLHCIDRCAMSSEGTSCETVVGTEGIEGAAAIALRYPKSVVIDSAGDYVIADGGNHRVQHCPASSPRSPCETVAGTGSAGPSSTELSYPTDVALHADGDYIVVDNSNHRVQRCSAASPGSECETIAGGSPGSGFTQLQAPEGVALDADGALLVVDTGNHRLQKCVVGAVCMTVFGGYGSGPAQFRDPGSVVVLSPVTTSTETTRGTSSRATSSTTITTPQATAAVVSGGQVAVTNVLSASITMMLST